MSELLRYMLMKLGGMLQMLPEMSVSYTWACSSPRHHISPVRWFIHSLTHPFSTRSLSPCWVVSDDDDRVSVGGLRSGNKDRSLLRTVFVKCSY